MRAAPGGRKSICGWPFAPFDGPIAGARRRDRAETVVVTIETWIFLLSALWWGLAAAVHLGTIATAWIHPRFRAARRLNDRAPPVSVIVPLKGLDAELAGNLASLLRQDYPDYEVLFSVAEADDPAAAVARRAIAEAPHVPARLVVGAAAVSNHLKTNNMIRPLGAARHDAVLITDSNVRSEPDRIAGLMRHLGGRQGLVSATAAGARPDTMAGELECAFLNGYCTRFLLFGDRIGRTVALGKTMLFRRSDLERAGGITQLARGGADDVALTRAITGLGLRVAMAERAAVHPVAGRRFGEVWSRHARWLVYRRDYALLTFVLEPFGGGLVAAAMAGLVGAFNPFGLPAALAVAAHLAIWYGAEAALLRARGWHLGWRSPLAWLARDAMLPAMWVRSMMSRRMRWRGVTVTVQPGRDLPGGAAALDEPVAGAAAASEGEAT